LLSKLFPGAQFIHITRDPMALFPVDTTTVEGSRCGSGVSLPRHDHLDQYVYDALLRMYDASRSSGRSWNLRRLWTFAMKTSWPIPWESLQESTRS